MSNIVSAQIGQYSLYAAAAGRKVVTIEPFYDNILRIHKAAQLGGSQNNITLIANALSDKRNEIKLLQRNEKNVGGQSLMDNRDKVFSKSDMKTHPKAKYLVETILWDDIVPYLPLNEKNEKFTKAFVKMDIEAFEPYAFSECFEIF
jgi:FkbM family methyltransferase